MNSPQERRYLLLLLSAFVLLASVYNVTVPPFESPDELFHYPLVRHLATHRALPVLDPARRDDVLQPWQQEGAQPPLYYILAAALTAGIDTEDMDAVRRLNPHSARGAALLDGSNANVVIHEPGSARFPWRGTVLAVRVARLFSTICGVTTLYLTWALVRTLYPDRPRLALVTATFQAFLPMFLFISASVNNDNLVITLSALALLLLVRRMKSAPTRRATLGLGAVLGLAALSKLGALALLPFAAATSVWTVWKHRMPGRPFLPALAGDLALWALPLLLIPGWWYGRNYRLYGDLTGLSAFLPFVGRRLAPLTVATLWQERSSFLSSYWGHFGWINVPLPEGIYTFLNALALCAGMGLLLALGRWMINPDRRRWPGQWESLTAARALAWAWPLAIFASVLRWTSITPASQGRLVFPALGVLALGMVLGLQAWFPRRRRWRQVVTGATGGVLGLVSLLTPFLWIAPAYAPPPALTTAEVAARAQPLDVQFGDSLRLVGYQVEESPLRPGDPLRATFFWEALAPLEQEHTWFVHLLGEGERIVAQQHRFPGLGRLSATHLEPGSTWAEEHALVVPEIAHAPDTLRWAVGVYETETGIRLPARAPAGAAQISADRVLCGEVALQRRREPLDVRFGDALTLTDYELSAVVVAPGTRLTLKLEGQVPDSADPGYTLSVQLIDAQWRKAAHVERRLDGHPFDLYSLDVWDEAAPGWYDLQLMLYRQEGAELRYAPVTWQAHQFPQEFVTLTQVRVEAP